MHVIKEHEIYKGKGNKSKKRHNDKELRTWKKKQLTKLDVTCILLIHWNWTYSFRNSCQTTGKLVQIQLQVKNRFCSHRLLSISTHLMDSV